MSLKIYYKNFGDLGWIFMRCWGILKVSLNLFDILIEIWEDFVDNVVNFYD